MFIEILFLVQFSTVLSEVNRCPSGWFGPRCDYMCHCAGGNCLSDGQCNQGVKCETGWFGPSCQYGDISGKARNISLHSTPKTRPELLLDNDDETCVMNVPTLNLTWSESFIFTWLRITLRNSEPIHSIKLDFQSGASLLPCKQQRHIRPDNRRIDIYCTVESPVKQVNVQFDDPREVCSIYTSGGRNVALKQETQQTSNWFEFGMVHQSGLAVDGNKNNFVENGSCSHTNAGDPSPNWSVKFRNPVAVARYVLYSRRFKDSGASVRIQGIILESFNSTNARLEQYQDKQSSPQYVYNVVPTNHDANVSSVTIRATKTQYGPYLELCEVEVFGETVCPDGKYGFECEKTCDCQVKCEASYNPSFGCPQCPGLMCEKRLSDCPVGWFGPRCDYMCHCADRICTSTGQCDDGVKCEVGWFGPSCQYEDISRNDFILKTPLTRDEMIMDNDDETCAENVQFFTLAYSRSPFLFTWLRLILGNLENSNNIRLTFKGFDSLMSCKQERHFHVNDRTIDIYCTLNSSVNMVIVYFDVPQEVCSIYISGGRNVALKQQTYQSSNWTEYGLVHHSGRAVDGNKDNHLPDGSCTHTDVGDTSPVWSVRFRSPVTVSRYVLYNRRRDHDRPSERLSGFLLESIDSENVTVFEYQDIQTLNRPKFVYSVAPEILNKDVSNVTIKVRDHHELLIELCEVNIFGETDCPEGKYGFDCNETCDCPVKCETSYNRSMGCPQCPAGYQGKMCDEKVGSTEVKIKTEPNQTCECPVSSNIDPSQPCSSPAESEVDSTRTSDCSEKCDVTADTLFEGPFSNQSQLCDKETNETNIDGHRTDLVIVICCLSFVIVTLVVVIVWQYRSQKRLARRTFEDQRAVFIVDNDQDMKAALI